MGLILKSKTKASIAGVVVAASIVTGAVADDPADLVGLVDDDDDELESSHVETLTESELPEYKISLPPAELSKADKRRVAVLSLPAAVKALILLPLWTVGKMIITLLSLLWTAINPYLGIITGFVLNLALMFCVFAVCYKALFPKHKIKELFKKRNFPWLIAGAVGITVADALLEAFVPVYGAVRICIILVSGFLMLLLLWWRVCSKLKAPEPKERYLDTSGIIE